MRESPIRVERSEPNQVGWNGDGWEYTWSVRVRGLTRFHDARVQFVLSAGNGNGGQGMRSRRAGHARLARALGDSIPNPFLMRLVEIDRRLQMRSTAAQGRAVRPKVYPE